MSSSFDHLVHYSIGLLCLVTSSVLYFFYFNSIGSVIDRPFVVAYLQSSLNLVILSILVCLFENSRFKLVKNKTNRLLYSPLNQFEDSDMQIFEMTRPFSGKNEKSFLTESVYEDLHDDETASEEDEKFKIVPNNPEYIVKINEEYNQLSSNVNSKPKQNKNRKVKFNKKKEVRRLKGIYAQSAILSRLSYESFLQFNYQLMNHYSNLAFSNSISIVPIYSLIYFLSIFFLMLSIEPAGYFDLNPGFSLLFILVIQHFYFNPSLTERITLTKSILCIFSLISLYLIRCSSTIPSPLSTTASPVNQTILTSTTLSEPETGLFAEIRYKSLIYALLSAFLSTLFVCSIRNKYEQDDFDIKVFSSFLSLFTMVAFGAILLFVLNRRLTEPILPFKPELLSIFQPFGQFFLIM